MSDETVVERATARYPPPDISPREFEEFVTQLLGSAAATVDDLVVTPRDRITGVDGTFVFDATARYQWAGMSFLVVIEAKRQKNPIKRSQVQVLHQQVQSIGGHKSAMFSTAPYQRGAVDFAKTHGVALATVTEGRFTFETRALDQTPPMSREEAAERFGAPTFVCHHYGAGDQPGSIRVTLISPEHPDNVAELLLGRPHDTSHG